MRQIINVAGTMTRLGASSSPPEVVQAVAEILPRFVEIDDLQRAASSVISELTGAEAGFVTASSAAGLTLAVAGAMTGADFAAIERLPSTAGLKSEVLLPMGHAINYGAPINQAIRLAGARVRLIGQATSCQAHHIEIGPETAAAVYVVSHHCVDYGMPDLASFAKICHAKGVPVIVDAASEYDLRGFLAEGADVVLYSGHKFLAGPTSGIVAGRQDLVRAAYLQNHGIGRGMKVGKEGIAGAIAALRLWSARDHAAIRLQEEAVLQLWQEALSGLVHSEIVPDPTGNPLSRLKVFAPWHIAEALAEGPVSVIVRDEEIERGYFELDPCNLREGQAKIVAERLVEVLSLPSPAPSLTVFERKQERLRALLNWPA